MNLKGIVHYKLGEGLTEEELASTVDFSVETLVTISADELAQDRTTWANFAGYFHVDANFLRSGVPLYSEGLLDVTESVPPSPLGPILKVSLPRWDQIDQMVTPEEPSRVIHADAMLETDAPGIRTFAMQVRDNSMQPLFSDGEVIWCA